MPCRPTAVGAGRYEPSWLRPEHSWLFCSCVAGFDEALRLYEQSTCCSLFSRLSLALTRVKVELQKTSKENLMFRCLTIVALAAAGLMAHCTSAKADGLRFRNFTSEPVYVAVAHLRPTEGPLSSGSSGLAVIPPSGWIVRGWYEVLPGQTREPIYGRLGNTYYYYFARSATKVWEGSQNFKILPKYRFRFFREDGYGYHNLPSGAEWKGFREIDTGGRSGYTVNLR